eukprot:1598033-Pleurochrysis_carterae.AAC.1
MHFKAQAGIAGVRRAKGQVTHVSVLWPGRCFLSRRRTRLGHIISLGVEPCALNGKDHGRVPQLPVSTSHFAVHERQSVAMALHERFG